MLKLSAQIQKFTKYYLCSGNFQWQCRVCRLCVCVTNTQCCAHEGSAFKMFHGNCQIVVHGLSSLNSVAALSPSLSVCECYIVILYNAKHTFGKYKEQLNAIFCLSPCASLGPSLCLCLRTRFQAIFVFAQRTINVNYCFCANLNQ